MAVTYQNDGPKCFTSENTILSPASAAASLRTFSPLRSITMYTRLAASEITQNSTAATSAAR